MSHELSTIDYSQGTKFPNGLSDNQEFTVSVTGAVIRNERYLTIIRSVDDSHAPNTLSFPGGRVEAATLNSPTVAGVLESTLRRELREEVAVEIEDIAYLQSRFFLRDDQKPVINIVYHCQHAAGDPNAQQTQEIEQVEWLPLDGIRTHPKTQPWFHDIIDAVERYRSVHSSRKRPIRLDD